MSVAARVAQEMDVKLGNEVSTIVFFFLKDFWSVKLINDRLMMALVIS